MARVDALSTVSAKCVESMSSTLEIQSVDPLDSKVRLIRELTADGSVGISVPTRHPCVLAVQKPALVYAFAINCHTIAYVLVSICVLHRSCRCLVAVLTVQLS